MACNCATWLQNCLLLSELLILSIVITMLISPESVIKIACQSLRQGHVMLLCAQCYAQIGHQKIMVKTKQVLDRQALWRVKGFALNLVDHKFMTAKES